MNKISVNNSYAVFGRGEYAYQRVVDDFANTNFIGILTYNISAKSDSHLLNALRNACKNGTKATIITNIPKRFPSYYGTSYAAAAKRTIDIYIRLLNPSNYGMRLSTYFSFSNHAKIILTDNMVYWGSGNFSDESKDNFECGSISTDKETIAYIRDVLFPEVQDRSVPYYKNDFAVAIANLENFIPACREAKQTLFESSYEPWADYDTNFEEKWLYRTTDSQVTIAFLNDFTELLAQFDDALNIIEQIVEKYWELDELPDQVARLSELFEEYKKVYDDFGETISCLFENLEQMASYDVSEEASTKISRDYGMEAYDENLDHFAELAMNEAANEYEELINGSKETVDETLAVLDSMIRYLEQLRDGLQKLLEVNSRIDNTGISFY